MATEFLQSYLEDTQFIPTSSVSSISATTDSLRVNVSLSCENGRNGNPETFYTTTLYAFGDVVELSDVGSLVEEYFRQRGKVTDIITITFDDVSLDVHFLYSEYWQPYQQGFDPQKMFFLSAMAQRVHQDSIVTIASEDHGSNIPFVIKAVGHRASDGTIAVVSKSEYRTLSTRLSTAFRVQDIIEWALNHTDAEAGEDLRDVMYFSIEYGGVQKMCYIVPAPAYLTFSFANAFNVIEYVDVVGEMTSKTEVSRDVVVCDGKSRQYDRTIERTFQMQTEPLTADEVSILEQLIASHHVALVLDSDEVDVIVTDHTCEPSTDGEALTTVKFTWQFADNRPRVFSSLMDGVIPPRRQIFDDTFSPEYE